MLLTKPIQALRRGIDASAEQLRQMQKGHQHQMLLLQAEGSKKVRILESVVPNLLLI
jgi:hypothetical protein